MCSQPAESGANSGYNDRECRKQQNPQEASMAEFFEKVTGEQDIFRKLSSYIPGFSGYVERSNRRAADKLLRETVARRFESLYTRASALQTELVNAGKLAYLDDMESAVVKIQTFRDKVATATYGYSGFFDAVKINQEQLAK